MSNLFTPASGSLSFARRTASPQGRPNRRRRRSGSPDGLVQTLEDKVVLSSVTVTLVGGELQITGTTQNDFARTIQRGALTVVQTQSGSSIFREDTYTTADITNVVYRMGAGNDVVEHRIFRPSLIEGEAGDDNLSGGNAADRILGGIGNDIMSGFQGFDIMDGGAGNDRMSGDEGNDRMFGGSGADTIDGDDGDDEIFGTASNGNVLRGGAGDDFIVGSNGTDDIEGGIGNDFIRGLNGNDVISGGAGNDEIEGGNNEDRIDGDAGDDTIRAGNGADVVFGGDGADTIFGQQGWDTLYGNDGIDIIDGGTQPDRLFGGALGDTLTGGDDDDRIFGDAGNDTINGGAGNDLLYGQDGLDEMDGGLGDDVMYGGPGVDTMFGDNRVDSEFDGNDILFGGLANDALAGDGGNDILNGELGDDILNGDTGNDRLYGQAGADTLNGGAGNDGLFGGIGFTDNLNGGTGADRLLQWVDSNTGVEDNLGVIALEDAVLFFQNATTAVGPIFVPNGTINYSSGSFTDAEIAIVDAGLDRIHTRTSSTFLLQRADGVFLNVFRVGTQTSGPNAPTFTDNAGALYLSDAIFPVDGELFTASAVTRAMAYLYDEPAENTFIPDFRAISSWQQGPGAGLTASGFDNWYFDASTEFAPVLFGYPASTQSPFEDWASIWQFYLDSWFAAGANAFAEATVVNDTSLPALPKLNYVSDVFDFVRTNNV